MLTRNDVRNIKIVVVTIATGLMLFAATVFWTEVFDNRDSFTMVDLEILALRSPWYQGTVLIIVGMAGLLLWRWLRAPNKDS